ncbi:hypothetical protein PRUB_a5375 [Pseudoalteromonas rubra]|uniref:Uncharacterized protein n=1 Tax=Pseudoalteromonas rubra TaxID=43658 RepID=A0A8T0CHP2_9GAMM|nr:hypothetical protein PRUB_a5375 [Pseudoalteromonas rubra]
MQNQAVNSQHVTVEAALSYSATKNQNNKEPPCTLFIAFFRYYLLH